MMVQIGVRVDESVLEEIDNYAKADDRDRSTLIRIILRDWAKERAERKEVAKV